MYHRLAQKQPGIRPRPPSGAPLAPPVRAPGTPPPAPPRGPYPPLRRAVGVQGAGDPCAHPPAPSPAPTRTGPALPRSAIRSRSVQYQIPIDPPPDVDRCTISGIAHRADVQGVPPQPRATVAVARRCSVTAPARPRLGPGGALPLATVTGPGLRVAGGRPVYAAPRADQLAGGTPRPTPERVRVAGTCARCPDAHGACALRRSDPRGSVDPTGYR